MQDPFSDDLMAHVVYEKIWLFFSRFAKKNRAKNEISMQWGQYFFEVPSEVYITYTANCFEFSQFEAV